MSFQDAKISVGLSAHDSRTLGLVTQVIATLAKTYSYSFTTGAGADQANTIYAVPRTLGASADSVDLTGALADAFGATITNARIKVLGIYNSGNATITVTTSGTNGWTAAVNGVVTLPAGGLLLLAVNTAAGWAVTAGTGDLISVAGTEGQTYDLVAIGAAT